MADARDQWPENVPGKFYVGTQCLDCSYCQESAPENFARNDERGHSYVSKQPANMGEEKKVQEALEGCPLEAIGSDGVQ